MGAQFVAASTQYLSNVSSPLPSTGYPFSVGMWIKLAAVGASARTLFSFSDTGTTNNYLSVRMTATETISIVAAAGGVETVSSTAAPMNANTWIFFLAQFIASANRRLWIGPIHQANLNANLQNTTARAPTGLDTITIGALQTSAGVTEPWDGMIAEYWLAKTAVFDYASNNERLRNALGYIGPLGLPHIADNLVEYRSFRQYPTSDADSLDEVFNGFGQQTWTNTNGVTIGDHPSLTDPYVKPGQVIRNLMI